MSHADSIKTALDADSGVGGVATLLTGGIYVRENTQRIGINRKNTPAAYDSDDFLKPLCVIVLRSERPWGGGRDAGTQLVTVRAVAELHFLGDGDGAAATIETASQRARVVLDYRKISGNVYQARWMGDLGPLPEPELNAWLYRSDYAIYGWRSA